MRTLSPISALPPRLLHLRLAPKLFRENQLSPVRLEFLRYPTPHPRTFQRAWVRASIQCYLNFTLDMGRSPGFRVYDHVLNALFRLAFAAAPPLQLNLARDRNSPVHSTKARHHPLTGSDYCRHTVSGSLSLPSGAFHLSLTVLVHYRSLGSI